MALFQDEPDEKPRSEKPGSLAKRSLFGAEPEEKRPQKSIRTRAGFESSLFGEEPEETLPQRCVSGGSSSSSGSGYQPQKNVSVDWTTMHLYSQANFLKKTGGN